MISSAVTTTAIIAVLVAVYSIFFLNVYLSRPEIDVRLDPARFIRITRPRNVKVPPYRLRGTIIGVANTLQIMIMESLYFSVRTSSVGICIFCRVHTDRFRCS